MGLIQGDTTSLDYSSSGWFADCRREGLGQMEDLQKTTVAGLNIGFRVQGRTPALVLSERSVSVIRAGHSRATDAGRLARSNSPRNVVICFHWTWAIEF